ncbi:MAG: hypothetical protein C3F15_08705, partial [Holophagae bacterium]
SPTHSWTDSPGGNYGDNRNISLTSPVLNLTGMTGATLQFDHIYDLEAGWDYGHVEVSANGGTSWSTVASYSGVNHTTWETVAIEVPQLDGVANARVRFRLTSDTNTTEDGWHIDDILVRAIAPVQDFTLDASPGTAQICAGDDAQYSIIVGSISGFSSPVTLAASGQPAGSTAGFTPNPVAPPGSSLLTIGSTAGAAGGSYLVTVSGSASGSPGHAVSVLLEVGVTPAPPTLVAPPDGATGQPLRPVFEWTAAAGADAYTLEVDDDAGFGSPAISESGILGTTYVASIDLAGGTSYYWRVRSENLCGAGAGSSVFSFTTGSSLPFSDGFESGDTSAWSTTVP